MNGSSRPDASERGATVEHFFRHEYGRMVAALVRRAGPRNLAVAEDAAQAALARALDAWVHQGVPDNPAAWLNRVAHNHLSDALRAERRQHRILQSLAAAEPTTAPTNVDPNFSGEVTDEMLRMLFICCDETIGEPTRLVLALKTLCGFSTAEIAFRLFTTEANIYKRLSRARDRLRERHVGTETPPWDALRSRVHSVRSVLYLLFNEGYLSTHAQEAIRRELCEEAIRLTSVLAEHPVGDSEETFALLALMHLHAARLAARQDTAGGLLLLEEQDRSRWDLEHLRTGVWWLQRSAHGPTFSRFHAEAGIAAEHCFAPTFAETRWDRIVELYEMLDRMHASPLHALNRAVAVAEQKGPQAGLKVLHDVVPPPWLHRHYLWSAVHADLYQRAGREESAAQYREQALEQAPSEAVRTLLSRRLAGIG